MGAVAPPWAFIYSSKLVNFCCGGRRLMRTRPGSSSRLGALFRLRLREASCFGARGARAGWSALLRSVRPFPVLALPAAFCAGRAGRSVRSVRPPRAGRLALPGCLRRVTTWEKTTGTLIYSEPTAAALALRRCREQLLQEFPDAEIEAEQREIFASDGVARAAVAYIFTADIAEPQ